MGKIEFTPAEHGTYNTILPLKFWVTKEILANLPFLHILANFGAKKLLQKYQTFFDLIFPF